MTRCSSDDVADKPGRRAQTSIATIILFVAAALIAAVTAGVLFDVTGGLEGSAEDTSEQAGTELTDRLEEVVTTGEVDNGTIVTVNVTVTAPADAAPTDLLNTTVQWVGPEQAHTLRNADAVDDPETTPVFEVVPATDADDSFTRDAQVLSSPDDRYVIVLRPGVETLRAYGATTVEAFEGAALAPNETATIRLTTAAGATTGASVRVPPQLIGLDNVEL